MSIPIDDFPGGGGGGSIPFSITTLTLSIGNNGSPYFYALDASGGYTPYNWSITSGALPTGITLGSDGTLSGIPTVSGSFSFTVMVQDAIGTTRIRAFTLQIDTPSSPVIITTTIPISIIGIPYSTTLSASGGTIPYTSWNITVGSLPPGLTLNSTTGTISGTPSSAGSYNFTVEVSDSAANTGIQSFSLLVQSVAPIITTNTTLPSGSTNVLYNTTISATGGTTPYVTWEVISSSLPGGLNLISSPTTATILGTPSISGNFSFTVKVTDSNATSSTKLFNITIANGDYPNISTNELASVPLNSSYSQTLIGSGGSLPYVWSIIDGNLPPGLSLNNSTGIISGIATTVGSYIFTVKLLDASNNVDTNIFSITVGNYFLPSIITNKLSNGLVGRLFNYTIQGAGGTIPYTWSLIGTLPSGLELNPNTGEIFGIPTTASLYNFSIILTDDDDNIDIEDFSIRIGNSNFPIIKTTSLPIARLSIYYSNQLEVLGGTSGYTWTLQSGVMPPGILLSSSGFITGAATQIGSYNFDIQVTDANSNTFIQSYNLLVTSEGFDSSCCFCVFSDSIVNLTSNTSTGVLTASGGTVLSNTQWASPSTAGLYTLTITSDSINGQIQTQNIVTVVEKLKTLNIDSELTDLLPGDSFQIETNYPHSDIKWETIGWENQLVTPNGTIYITSNPADKWFGAINCKIRGTRLNLSDCNLNDYVEFNLVVNPVYPTPDNCGPDIEKWLRETKEFKTIITEFEGGCDETHLKTPIPTLKWTINYSGLTKFNTDEITCPSCLNQILDCGGCNDDIHNYDRIVTGCHPYLKSANRLDEFWNLTYGEYKTFNLVDHDTGEVWYNVRFDGTPSVDHRHRRVSNTRTFKIIWKPCCNTQPRGGTCSKHGMVNYKPKRISDCTIPSPSTPYLISLDNTCYSSIIVNWTESKTKSIIAGYEIKYNNLSILVDNVNTWTLNHLIIDKEYTIKVRSLDIFGNYSEWSNTKIITTKSLFQPVFEAGEPVVEDGNQVIELFGCNSLPSDEQITLTGPNLLLASPINYNTISLSWLPSIDALSIAGYQLKVNGGLFFDELIDVENVFTFIQTDLFPLTNYTYEIRGYDNFGNYSSWSVPTMATTSINEVDGGDSGSSLSYEVDGGDSDSIYSFFIDGM